MCFPSQAPNQNVNPAPYALNNSAAATTESVQAVNPPGSSVDNSLGPQARAKDAQDKPTPPVTGVTVTPGLMMN